MTNIFDAAFRQRQIHDPFWRQAGQLEVMQGSRNSFPQFISSSILGFPG